ncbi:MAG: M15 family metallopeptidase [Ignavibacteriaceae bacterium]|nr:M15 family metallopeptidase [Ignavibacteriaceae bacterium]
MKLLLRIFLLNFLFLFSTGTIAQEIPENEYGLKVVSSYDLYASLIENDSNQILVNLESFIPGIKKDVKYATDDNVTGAVLYNTPGIFLRLPAAIALTQVQEELLKSGLELKIYDAYRPYAITKKIWEFVLDENYAASPQTGSRHNRGCAVDLTIIVSSTGEELNMPTLFDDFSEMAHHGYNRLPVETRVNRSLLKNVMERFGFVALKTEWWHYDFKDWRDFPLMDISFDELIK